MLEEKEVIYFIYTQEKEMWAKDFIASKIDFRPEKLLLPCKDLRTIVPMSPSQGVYLRMNYR